MIPIITMPEKTSEFEKDAEQLILLLSDAGIPMYQTIRFNNKRIALNDYMSLDLWNQVIIIHNSFINSSNESDDSKVFVSHWALSSQDDPSRIFKLSIGDLFDEPEMIDMYVSVLKHQYYKISTSSDARKDAYSQHTTCRNALAENNYEVWSLIKFEDIYGEARSILSGLQNLEYDCEHETSYQLDTSDLKLLADDIVSQCVV